MVHVSKTQWTLCFSELGEGHVAGLALLNDNILSFEMHPWKRALGAESRRHSRRKLKHLWPPPTVNLRPRSSTSALATCFFSSANKLSKTET